MSRSEDNGMGRVLIDLIVANNDDMAQVRRRQLTPDRVRRLAIRGVADSGAVRLVLPRGVVRQLGLVKSGKATVRYADGRAATRDTVQGVYVEILGRGGVFSAVVEPKRDDALVGAIVLEDLDLLIDCSKQRLVPRDPDTVISEIGW
jgi:hypothetical protein